MAKNVERCRVCGVRVAQEDRVIAPLPTVAPSECCGTGDVPYFTDVSLKDFYEGQRKRADVPGQMYIEGIEPTPAPEYVTMRTRRVISRMLAEHDMVVCDYCERNYRERITPKLAIIAGEYMVRMNGVIREWYREMQIGIDDVDGVVQDHRK